jgi:CelD/BcsL family acetyltransferase involved in cellulose biosynthesis
VISFGLIETNTLRLPFPFQKSNFSENLVVSLPESVEEYFGSLGNATRRNIKYYTNKIKRNFPSFNYQFYEKDAVTEQHIRDIVNLKLASFAARNRHLGLSISEVEKIFSLVKNCNGLVGIATIDGAICAGQISYRIGTNDVASIIAHDPQYNNYSIGMICCYLTICECIVRKGKEFHFL